jgi:hypothetical protein
LHEARADACRGMATTPITNVNDKEGPDDYHHQQEYTRVRGKIMAKVLVQYNTCFNGILPVPVESEYLQAHRNVIDDIPAVAHTSS